MGTWKIGIRPVCTKKGMKQFRNKFKHSTSCQFTFPICYTVFDGCKQAIQHRKISTCIIFTCFIFPEQMDMTSNTRDSLTENEHRYRIVQSSFIVNKGVFSSVKRDRRSLLSKIQLISIRHYKMCSAEIFVGNENLRYSYNKRFIKYLTVYA